MKVGKAFALGTGLRFRVLMTQMDRGMIGWEVNVKAWQAMGHVLRNITFHILPAYVCSVEWFPPCASKNVPYVPLRSNVVVLALPTSEYIDGKILSLHLINAVLRTHSTHLPSPPVKPAPHAISAAAKATPPPPGPYGSSNESWQ